jgi:hypothetical protein
MQCPNCRAEIPDDSVFCHECGTKIESPPQPPVASPGGPTSRAEPEATPTRAKTSPEAPRSRYAGVSLVSGTLWVLGWLIAIVGFILAVGMAGFIEEASDEDISGGEQLALFVSTLIVFWLIAVGVLWSAYVLRLLSDIEGRLSGRSK